MSEPEIARRCSACGASVRQSALFCPQCGNPMGDPSGTPKIGKQRNEAGRSEKATAAQSKNEPLKVERPQAKAEGLKSRRDTIYRAADAARAGFDENVRGRVEKLRKASGVVIDQAAYDPSLRFLLVAAVMFLLFVVLLILSKVIG